MRAKQRWIDILLVLGMILPFVGCMVLKVCTAVPEEGVSINGAQIYFTIPMPLQDLPITEAQVVSAAVLVFLFFLCLFLTRNLKVRHPSTRQVIAEYIVTATEKMVGENMGDFFERKGYAPLIAAIMGLSLTSSLSGLLVIFPPTGDVNIIAGWAILVFILLTYYKLKGGLWNYVRGFFDPIPLFAPMNLLGEVSTPVSMSFRHFGNVLSGMCVSALLSFALGNLSNLLFSFLPSSWVVPPLLRIGIPAVFSIYFDVFSSALQAFIFAMLTMLNISTAFPMDLWQQRREKKAAKKAERARARARA